jgi:hypothetical protein
MLIETHSGGERKVGTDPYKHLSPAGVLNIKVVLLDPTTLHLQMPAVVFPDRGHGGSWLDLSAPPKDLTRKRRSFLMKQKSDWKRITLLKKTSFKKEIKNIGRQ